MSLATDLGVVLQTDGFDVAQLQQSLLQGQGNNIGAVASFTGYVRGSNEGKDVQIMELEHYPGMAEKSISETMAKAAERWPIIKAHVVHRVGKLQPGDEIVWVGVCSSHREAAFAACDFIMDFLKLEAPFWKKESNAEGESAWVEARDSDNKSAERWNQK